MLPPLWFEVEGRSSTMTARGDALVFEIGEAHDARADGRVSEVMEKVDVSVDVEVRIEGQADQAALAAGEDGQLGKGLRQQLAVLDDAHAASVELVEEQASVGREGQRHGQIQSG